MASLTVVAVVMVQGLIELLAQTKQSVREDAHPLDTLLALNCLKTKVIFVFKMIKMINCSIDQPTCEVAAKARRAQMYFIILKVCGKFWVNAK